MEYYATDKKWVCAVCTDRGSSNTYYYMGDKKKTKCRKMCIMGAWSLLCKWFKRCVIVIYIFFSEIPCKKLLTKEVKGKKYVFHFPYSFNNIGLQFYAVYIY